MAQPLAFSRRASSASTASRMKSPRLFARPITASIRSSTEGESRTVVSFTPSAGRPMRRVVSDSCKTDKPIAFMLTDLTDSPYITAIGYGDKAVVRDQLHGRVCQVCSPEGGACFTKRSDGYNECNNCGTRKRRRAPTAKAVAAKAESDRKIAAFLAWLEASA